MTKPPGILPAPPKTTLILLAVLVVFGAVAFFAQGPGRRDRPRAKADVLPGLDPKEVQAVRIGKDAGAVALTIDGGRWTVGEESFPADGELVESFLASLAGLKEEAVVSTNPAKRSLYDADPERGIPVRLEASAGRLLGELVVGKAGPDYASAFVRRRDEERVILVATDLRGMVSRPVEGWRDRKIVPFGGDEITAVQVQTGGAPLTLRRPAPEGAWLVNGRGARPDAVEGFLELLAHLRAADFAAAGEEAHAGFGDPVALVTIEAGTKKVVITLGAKKADASQSYLKTDQSPVIFLVSQYVADSLLKKEVDFPHPAPEKK